MTPQLSIVKTRFAKASLRPRCARHRSWRATCRLPNACVGHSATQCLRWTLSYPMLALVVKLPNERYGPSGRSLSTWRNSTIPVHRVARTGPSSNYRGRFSCAIIQVKTGDALVANSPKHDGFQDGQRLFRPSTRCSRSRRSLPLTE